MSRQIAFSILTLQPFDLARCSQISNARTCFGRNHRHSRVSRLQRFDLRLSQIPCADNDAGSCSDLQENWKEVHGIKLLSWRVPSCADRRRIALDRVHNSTGKLRTKAVTIHSREVSPQVFVRLACVEIAAQQPLNGVGNLVSSSPVTEWTSGPRESTYCSTDAEVEGVDQLPILLDLLTLEPD